MGDDPWKPADLVDRIRQGSRSAEEELVARYHRRVHCMILARTGSRETARDLSQDVVVHLLNALRSGRLRDATKLTAFVHGVARNVVADHRRARRNDPEVPLEVCDVARPNADDLVAAERMAIVRRAIERLRASDRSILQMLFVEGASLASIAAKSGVPVEVVRQRKSRALKRVRAALARGLPSGPRRGSGR